MTRGIFRFLVDHHLSEWEDFELINLRKVGSMTKWNTRDDETWESSLNTIHTAVR